MKSYKIQLPVPLFIVVLYQLRAFTSADIIFYNFLKLHSNYLKKIVVTNFPFLMGSPKPPHPFNGQNLLSVTKVFC